MGVEPPNQLKAKHFTDPNIEHISVMAFLTKLMQIGEKHDRLRIIGLNLNNVFVNKEVSILVNNYMCFEKSSDAQTIILI